jgi:hypothetical protein
MRKEGGEKDVQNREANMECVDIQKNRRENDKSSRINYNLRRQPHTPIPQLGITVPLLDRLLHSYLPYNSPREGIVV